MGIKHFFPYFKKHFSNHIRIGTTNEPIDQEIDTLGIDLNGIFHPAAQKIYRYGKNKSLLLPPLKSNNTTDLKFFKEVCRIVEELVVMIHPRKRLLLCVDGVAGASKMAQQRKRRFVSAKENTNPDLFDSNSLTPGTILMDKLTHYLEWFIYKKTQTDWKHLEVLFSNEKVPGEGEHKIKLMMQEYCNPDEFFCIYGLDADLIMLCLSACKYLTSDGGAIYVVRDDPFVANTRYLLDIGAVAIQLRNEMGTNSSVEDFVFMCFMVGNDFLPQIHSLEILRAGIDTLMSTYDKVGKPHGLIHLPTSTIRVNTFMKYITCLAATEEVELKNKFSNRYKYFPDKLMEDFFSESDNKVLGDFEKYKKEFYKTHFPLGTSVETICKEYFKGLQWVTYYYNVKIPSWKWHYPYHYAPFLSDLLMYSYSRITFTHTIPYDPFNQLLSVLPPKSASLIPLPLSTLLLDEQSPVIQYYPKIFDIDLGGKRREWEGIVLLPMMDMTKLSSIYKSLVPMISKKDTRRNIKGKEYRYAFEKKKSYSLSHKYGSIIKCFVSKNELCKDINGVYIKDAR